MSLRWMRLDLACVQHGVMIDKKLAPYLGCLVTYKNYFFSMWQIAESPGGLEPQIPGLHGMCTNHFGQRWVSADD